MDAQTSGALLPGLLLLTPLVLGVIDFFRIGRIARDAQTPQATSWPSGNAQI